MPQARQSFASNQAKDQDMQRIWQSKHCATRRRACARQPAAPYDARAASAHRGVRARGAAPVARGPTWCRRRASRPLRLRASSQVGGRPPSAQCPTPRVLSWICPISAPSAKCGHCRPCWSLQVGGSWPRPQPDYPSPSARRPAEPRPSAVLVRVDAGFCRAPTQVCLVRGRSALVSTCRAGLPPDPPSLTPLQNSRGKQKNPGTVCARSLHPFGTVRGS